MYYKNFHEECSLVCLANYIKLIYKRLFFSLYITNYHIDIVEKHI